MKNTIRIGFLLFVFWLPMTTFGYMEAKLFCRINQQAIKVSLSSQDGSRCQSYISYIEQTMRQTARDLYVIQWYINVQQDVQYWTAVKEEKLSSIDTLQWLRLDIIAHMKTFESTLLQKSVGYFILKITPYKIKLTQSLLKLSALTWTVHPSVQRLQTLMSGQVQTIEKIAKVETFEELIPLLSWYIYFKQQISWKSE